MEQVKFKCRHCKYFKVRQDHWSVTWCEHPNAPRGNYVDVYSCACTRYEKKI